MTRMKTVFPCRLMIALYSGLILLGLWCGTIWAHTLPVRSEPGAGAMLTTSPDRVRIWFDDVLDRALSIITVKNAEGQKVDKGGSRVNPADQKLLEVSLPTLQPGTYRVIWTVVGRDGHSTTGDYVFTIK